MKYELLRYQDYKDSEVDWIGQTPSEWVLTRNKDIFEERGELSYSGTETLLTVSHITGVTRRSEKNVNMFMAETMEGYKLCRKGDLIINTMWAWMGALGTSNEDGICSPSYGVYKPKKDKPYYHRYFDYLYRTPNAITEMTRNSKGIVSSRLRLYPKEFFQIKTALPDYMTQQAIADYLDAKTMQIDRKIKLLNQKASQYSNLKQSLINETVTLGLDKTVAMKDSAIEWIGKIPKHWKIKRLKDIIEALESGSREKGGASDTGVFSLSAEHIDWEGHFNFTNEKFVTEEYYEKMTSGKLRIGDILLTKDGATIGKCAYLDKLYFGKMAINEHMFLLRSSKEIDNKFLYYLITSPIGRLQIRNAMNITAIPGINSSFIMDVFFPITHKKEQKAIAEYLDTKIAHIDRIVETINIQIDKLKELRKTLINDVVTGKIKVIGEGKAV